MKLGNILLASALIGLLATPAFATTKASMDVKSKAIQEINVKCINCHLKNNNGIVKAWEGSMHAAAKEGQVGCYNCHAAEKDDPAGYNHEGAFMKAVLSPTDCKGCHEREVKEMAASHHATAGEIMASLDNMLAETIGGTPTNKANMSNGCWQCHGSVVTMLTDKDGKPLRSQTGAPMMDHNTYPNSGIGRINLDGTKGSCNACHTRHSFAASRARQPENCGKCHLGPDHPQKEVYEESKHGIAYYSSPRGNEGPNSMNSMNIFKDGKWILGKDYTAAPTCSSCHMGSYVKANGSVAENTHNVGDRISWTLRPPVSVKLNRATFIGGLVQDVPGDIPPRAGQTKKVKTYERSGNALKKVMKESTIESVISWKDRRKNMQEVCANCHSVNHVEGFYAQFDDLVNLYNDKFAKPGVKLFKEMKKDKIWPGFGHEIGYIWFNVWHHEGRRARHGAAMQAPDYTHWHGLYEVAWHFYHKYLPKVQKIADKKGMGPKYKKMIDEILAKEEHTWFVTGLSQKKLRAIEEENKSRYKQ